MSRKRKPKRPKDPHAPKRPQSSYFLFMNERRPILKEEHQDKSMTDISKLISAEWKEIGDKTKYENKAAKLKAQYKIDLEEYQKTSNFRKFTAKLEEWKREQRELKEAEQSQSTEVTTNGNGSGSGRKKRGRSKKQESSSEEEESSSEDDGSSSSEESSDGDSSSGDSDDSSSDSSEDDDIKPKKRG
eukprot:CAMPEP_0201570626 /NCGR_PEP_ID=MMETSP0190_2-20130828/12959_1 /ASSEMBLY_ACC=CAM_ASM_000263 /TAXON_ID=37353 /ORGANISM="Rosalina sp." /LENGTH=186 /DNA_ID=CAMNT_0047994347 /DNA_START=31 /DNA_END=587 /DNA_ORIENTATION=+